MPLQLDVPDTLLHTWTTNHRVTVFLLENLPDELWPAKIPGAPRRTVRMVAGHIHNTRCMWIKMLGRKHGVTVPASVDRHRVTRKQLVRALDRSRRGVTRLLEVGFASGGTLPGAPFQNFPPDVVHLVAYFVAHEAHHRGQLVMLARQLGHRLPPEVSTGLWLWSKRAEEE